MSMKPRLSRPVRTIKKPSAHYVAPASLRIHAAHRLPPHVVEIIRRSAGLNYAQSEALKFALEKAHFTLQGGQLSSGLLIEKRHQSAEASSEDDELAKLRAKSYEWGRQASAPTKVKPANKPAPQRRLLPKAQLIRAAVQSAKRRMPVRKKAA